MAWERESKPLAGVVEGGGIPEEHTRALVRFGAFRAPAALFSHLVFWADFYVFSTLAGDRVTGVYAATLQAGQTLFLFLTSLSLMFSPFVADLHHRGEHEKLDQLYKSVTRWALAATLPILLVLLVMPDQVLRIFGSGFDRGARRAADPGRGDARAGVRRHGRLHLDHDRAHGLGPRGVPRARSRST